MGRDIPRNATPRTPSWVANVLMLYFKSPSTSGRSLVMAMTVANTVTKLVMNLYCLFGNQDLRS